MKKTLLTAFSAAVLAMATSGIASASITVGNPTITGQTWNYGIAGDGLESLSTTSFFTIYDFANYQAGSIFAPVGWTGTAQLVGTTPAGVVPVDSGTLLNLTFTYTGATEAVPTLSGFGANTTTTSGQVLGVFTYQAIKTSTSTLDAGFGNVFVPTTATATPEPMSMSLLGGGLALVRLARLRSRKA